MTNASSPAPVNSQTKFTGSLTATLVRTLLIFTFIPLALMAGATYFRARTLLREQAVAQSENLLVNQLKVIESKIQAKEITLQEQLSNDDFRVQVELGLHANPQSAEFKSIRNQFIRGLQSGDVVFDQFMLVGNDEIITVASNEAWQGQTIDLDALNVAEQKSIALYGLAPFYENEVILITAVEYTTERGSTLGTMIGITEKTNLQALIQPLNGLAPFADTFFILSGNQLISSDPETGTLTLLDSTSTSQAALITNLENMMAEGNMSPVAMDVTTPEGEDALAQMQWFASMQSGVVLEINSDNIYGQINSLTPFTILLIIGTVLATAFVLSLGIRRIIKPLQSLTAITKKFAEGEWNQRAEVSSNDEVGLLASSFNNMADQLGEVYQSLEKKVDERTRQIRTAAEVAQSVTAIPNLDEMLNKTSELLVNEFGFYQASIYTVERGGKYADFK